MGVKGFEAMQIAYLFNTYPRPSHSFIRREIRALERRGLIVNRIAMRGDRTRLVDATDIAEHDRTEHVLARGGGGGGALARTALRQLVRAPRRSLAALRLARAVARRSGQGMALHLVYLVEAAYVVRRCETLGVGHLHAHFGTNSAAVAMFAHALGGLSYSFTVHGPEEFDKPVALALAEKMRHAAFTVAISSFCKSQLCLRAEYDSWGRIHVVHCGIEPWAFAEPVPLPAGGLRLVSIGRLVEQKGQLLLVQALAAARATHPAVHLTLVGDGELRGAIEALVRAHELERHVTITGWVDEDRVRAELAAAHALVVPSFAEGLPMVVMEAMAACRPVIATHVAGIPELVQPGETGWLVPAGDAGALAGAIRALAETPRARLEDMGRAAQARVLARHDIDREASKLAELFGFLPAFQSSAAEAKPAPEAGSGLPGGWLEQA